MSVEPPQKRHRPLPSQSNCLVGPILKACRNVDEFEKLNRIEEGAYGIVYRARDKKTNEIIALKKLKLEAEKDGFPITSIREIHTLKLSSHPNIVQVKEIVVTNSLNHVFICMEYLDHDLKSLMEKMSEAFLVSEVKTLMLQLLSALKTLHRNWIIHRDLKTSNLLMNNRGVIKIADFGLARLYGSPLNEITQLVVTLWYRCLFLTRAPELLLGATTYSTEIDMWSVGMIFGELLNNTAVLPGKGELDQISKIFQLLGTPTEISWPGYTTLPNAKTVNFMKHNSTLEKKFPYLSNNGLDLMRSFLCYNPEERITAEEAMKHPFFTEQPLPKDPSLFPSFPSKSNRK